jgi:ribose transport system permease protein
MVNAADEIVEDATASTNGNAPPKQVAKRLRPSVDLTERYGLVAVWLLVGLFFWLTQPSFRTLQTVQIIIGSQSTQIAVTLAVIVVVIGGEFDLSVANVLGAAIGFAGFLNVTHHWPIALTVVVILAGAMVFALINAVIVLKVGVPSIIVTLGTGTVIMGITNGICGESVVGPISSGLVKTVSRPIFGLPISFYFVLLVGGILYFVLEHTPFGRHFRFIGTNRDVARLAGLRVNRLRVVSLVTCSTLAALAGILLVGTSGAADTSVAPGYLLPAFAGAFLGSTTIRPGQFNVWGGFVACLFLVTGVTGLELDGLTGWVVDVYNGASLVIAVAVTQIVARQRGKPLRSTLGL